MGRSPAATRVLPRWLVGTLGLIAVLLIPWTLWLTFSLPTRHITRHYDIAWVGFDIGLAAAFAATAVAALRASPWLQALAALTGTMLICDAWFDTVTATSSDEQMRAILEAVGAEIPLAALCCWIVVDTQRFHDAAARWDMAAVDREPGRGDERGLMVEAKVEVAAESEHRRPAKG
ncbi:MAG TPA: hypothetical protein VGM80_06160 [Gaiellaceae bacterium]